MFHMGEVYHTSLQLLPCTIVHTQLIYAKHKYSTKSLQQLKPFRSKDFPYFSALNLDLVKKNNLKLIKNKLKMNRY